MKKNISNAILNIRKLNVSKGIDIGNPEIPEMSLISSGIYFYSGMSRADIQLGTNAIVVNPNLAVTGDLWTSTLNGNPI